MTKARVQVSEVTIQRLLQGHTVTIRIAGVAEVEISKGQPRRDREIDPAIAALLKALFRR